VWLYFRFPLGLRMVEELLAARGIIVSHETVHGLIRSLCVVAWASPAL
jgi:transposase-like protein